MDFLNRLIAESVGEPYFYLWAVPAVLIFGISKGGFAGNLGIVAVPMIAVTVPIDQAAAIMLPVLCCMDLFGLLIYKNQFDMTNVGHLLPFAITGIGIGWLGFATLDAGLMSFLVGLLAFGYITSLLFRRRPPAETGDKPYGHSLWKAFIYGNLAGAASTVVHAGGIPAQMYLLPQKMNKKIFVGTTVVLYAFINYIKLIPYHFLGLLRVENLGTSLLLMPLAPVGIYLGKYLQGVIRQDWFYRFCYAMLFLTGVKLMYDGFPF